MVALYVHNFLLYIHLKLLFRCGPMTRYWCMRFEVKHNYFKDLAQKRKQFKNKAKCLPYHHQQLVCYQLSKSKSLGKEMETSEGIIKERFWYTIYVHDIMQVNIIKLLSCNMVIYSVIHAHQ